MRKTLITLLVALSAVGTASAAPTEASKIAPTAAAAKSPERSFTRDGYTYFYKVTQDASGRTLTGMRSDGEQFSLTVNGDRVVGDTDGVPVAFSVSDALVR